MKDLIRDRETGFLARPNDPTDFADRMEELIVNDSLRNSFAAEAFEAAAGRDWNKINRGLIENYREIIKTYKTIYKYLIRHINTKDHIKNHIKNTDNCIRQIIKIQTVKVKWQLLKMFLK